MSGTVGLECRSACIDGRADVVSFGDIGVYFFVTDGSEHIIALRRVEMP